MTQSHTHWSIFESPVGPLTLLAGSGGLAGIGFPGRWRLPSESARQALPDVERQLAAYFAGELREFDFELDLHGTPLQREVWRRLLEIPYGATSSYGELAARIDPVLFDPEVEPWRRARVVGAANRRNPVAIVVPCHRVIGADGSLVGYGGGLWRKRALLDLERGRWAEDRSRSHRPLSCRSCDCLIRPLRRSAPWPRRGDAEQGSATTSPSCAAARR
jgi:methylated-DNA-[protein]-cysteine S-methyltransferase